MLRHPVLAFVTAVVIAVVWGLMWRPRRKAGDLLPGHWIKYSGEWLQVRDVEQLQNDMTRLVLEERPVGPASITMQSARLLEIR